MSQTAVALAMLAVLVSVVHWSWSRLVTHVDLRLIPARSRRRVAWLLARSVHIQCGALLLLAGAICVQSGGGLG